MVWVDGMFPFLLFTLSLSFSFFFPFSFIITLMDGWSRKTLIAEDSYVGRIGCGPWAISVALGTGYLVLWQYWLLGVFCNFSFLQCKSRLAVLHSGNAFSLLGSSFRLDR